MEKATDYYEVITALAELKRNELKAFKERYLLAMAKAKENIYAKPYRVVYPRLDLGFIFIPLTDETIPFRANILQNFTLAHKYDQQLQKCIGISFAADGAEHYIIEWCVAEFNWEYNSEFKECISNNNPFREVKAVELPRYAKNI